MGKVIGLTGGIASGKSTVSNYLKTLGYHVLDSDVYARKVMEPNEEAYQNVVAHFGEEILTESGEINREKLGNIVFNDRNQLNKLNVLTHPVIKQRMFEDMNRLRENHHVFLDVPLLFENKRDEWCDVTITVYVTEEVQIRRLTVRNGLDKEAAKSRINSQMSLQKKRELSDFVFDNNQDKSFLYQQVDSFLEKLENDELKV